MIAFVAPLLISNIGFLLLLNTPILESQIIIPSTFLELI